MFAGARWIPRPGRVAALFAFFVLCAFFAGLAGPAWAEESATGPAPRALGGHLFLPSTLVPDPFIATSFASTTGGGSALDLVEPIYNLKGEKLGETSAEIAFLTLDFAYQQAIRKRFALMASFSGGGRMGTTPESVVSEGVSAVYGYSFGAMMSLVRRSNWVLSGSADVRGNTLYGVFPGDFVRAVVRSIADGDTVTALEAGQDTLLQKGDNSRVLGGLRAAYAPAAWIGFTGFLETGLGERFERGSDRISVTNFGVAASFDLNPLKRIPIGLIGSFRNESLSEKSGDLGSSQAAGLGVMYTGRQFFSIGLENTWSQITQARTDEKVDVVQSRILLRYDFY